MPKEKATTTRWRSVEETAKLYQELRAEKSSMQEIAKAMGRDVKYVYSILPKVAEILGVPKEELLYQHKTTKSSNDSSSEISKELQREEVVSETEEATAPENGDSGEVQEEVQEDVQNIPTNATLVDILNNLAETKAIINKLFEKIQEV